MNVYLYTEDGVNYWYYLCYLYSYIATEPGKRVIFLKKSGEKS